MSAKPRRKKTDNEIEVQRLVNRMTNHQRNQWARAGYPGLKKHEPEKVWAYTDLRLQRMFGGQAA